jgi:hypothetical protein
MEAQLRAQWSGRRGIRHVSLRKARWDNQSDDK